MKICIFGGTFDPLHIGHEKLIVTLLEKFDKVIVIPVKKSPEKNAPIASDMDRLKMLSLCDFYNNENLIVDDYEIKSNRSSNYTIDSIKYIRNKFKKDDIYLALGLDQLNNLSNWHNVNELLQLTKIICFNRKKIEKNISEKIEYEMIDDFNYDISSSQIKTVIKKDPCGIKTMVNKNIFQYIADEKLYQC